MDFKDFLKKNKFENFDNKLDKKDEFIDKNFESTDSFIEKKLLVEEPLMNFTEFKKGDFIKIIYLKDSALNYYKGYFGEIKSYTKNSKNVYILLDAINSNRELEFPITHLIKRKI